MNDAVRSTRHTKWGSYTAIVIETDEGKWYANIFHIKSPDEIDSFPKQGSTDAELRQVLTSFGAPGKLEWKPGNGE